MKKQILTAIAAILLTTSITFAKNSNPVPDQIAKELTKEFENASNVAWKATPNFYKASFTFDNQSLDAFFAFDGRLIGVSRTISVEQLPMTLIKAAAQKGAAKEITELFELLTDRGTEYFITFGTGKDQKTFKSGGSSWTRFDANTFKEDLL
jgi:hypothetical protein